MLCCVVDVWAILVSQPCSNIPSAVGGGRASGKGGSSSKRTPGSTSRYDSSLGLLTKKFVDLLQVRLGTVEWCAWSQSFDFH